MHSDALQKIRFALRYIEQAPGTDLLKLREAYVYWLTHISETHLPKEMVLDFRAVMHDIGRLMFKKGRESESQAEELVEKLKMLEEVLC